MPLAILLPSVAFYAWRGAARPFDLTYCLARYFALAIGAVVLSYFAAMTPLPLADPLLARADATLGFDWRAWYETVTSHRGLRAGLGYA